jgi:hypothetical protein
MASCCKWTYKWGSKRDHCIKYRTSCYNLIHVHFLSLVMKTVSEMWKRLTTSNCIDCELRNKTRGQHYRGQDSVETEQQHSYTTCA